MSKQKMEMSTISDVAKLSGVSQMTVSRAINNKGYVKQVTREKIEKAIIELGYRPNMVAKSLATRRTNILAYIVSDISDPFYNKVSKGIAETCLKHDFSFIICDATNHQILESQMNMLIDRLIDGVIFHDLDIKQDEVDFLLKKGRKIVMLENETKLDRVFSIRGDDFRGAKLATSHLISRGHKKIACLKGPTTEEASIGTLSFQDSFKRRTWIDRTNGYKEALKEAGLDYEMYFDGCVEPTMGYGLAQNFVERWMGMPQDERPTAVYCESDILALGVLSKAIECGIAVPDGLAIAGHDGLDMTSMIYPQITTIRQQRYEMGQISATMLIDFIEHGQKEGSRTLDVDLLLGQTT